MAATIITPNGTGAMEAGLVLDEEGSRFVVLTFKEPQGEPTLVTFTVPVFQNYVEHLVQTARPLTRMPTGAFQAEDIRGGIMPRLFRNCVTV